MTTTPESRLLELYDRVAEAPDAIDHLRKFVLDLAVRGKLVEQDPEDEPAEELLERIAEEKAQLVKTGQVRKDRIPAAIPTEEEAFTLPSTWQWTPATFPTYGISDLGKKIKTKDVLEKGKFPVVDQGKVLIRGYCDDQDKVIEVATPVIVFGDHTRETKLIDFDFVVGADGVKILHPICIDPQYYHLALQWLPLASRGYGRHFKLLKASSIPLPPLPEQHRIVAKVDELMALLDRLETTRTQRETTRDRLTTASLTRLTAPDTAEKDFPGQTRFALDNLDQLTSRPDQIKILRQTILDLAVRGKITMKEPTDGSASDLLERIQSEKAKPGNGTQIRKTKSTEALAVDKLPFNIPSNWHPARLSQILLGIQTGPFGSSLHKSDYTLGGTPVVNPASIQDGKIIPIDKMAVGETTLKRLASFKLQKDDIVMARRGEMGRCARVTEIEEGWLCGTGSLILRPTRQIFPDFLVLLIGTPFSRQYLGGTAVGSTMQNLNQSILLNLPFGLPPVDEQRRIVLKVNALMVFCDRLEAMLTTADAIRARVLETIVHEALPRDVKNQKAA